MSNSSASESENCENCSSSFNIFKRKKICNLCKQAFCQACVNRQTFSSILNNRNAASTQANTTSSSSSVSSSSERICVICQMICAPQTTVDDLMKLKLKHLRSILNTANVATSTCKEKRDLVELVLRNRFKFQQRTPQSQQQNASSSSSSSSSPPPQHTTFNDTFSNFMNNVQEFVNFNLNSALNQPHPAPAPPPSSSSSSSTSTNGKKTFTQSSTNFNLNGQPTSTSSSSSNSSSQANNQMPSSSSSSSNLNSIFNLIGEQVPNVLQQTFNNNRFTFNTNNERRGSTASTNSNTRQATPPPPAPPPPPPPSQPTQSEATPSESSFETSSAAAAATTAPAPKRRASLSDIKSESDIENLNVKQIKEILALNFVDYKGCCEKKELVEKAKRLYNSYENNKRLEKELINNENINISNSNNNNNNVGATSSLNSTDSSSNCSNLPASMTTETSSSKKPAVDESDLCKICMESLIDCVLLDCGHMVSCTKCGKRLAECPICRQNVIRVIRVFKS